MLLKSDTNSWVSHPPPPALFLEPISSSPFTPSMLRDPKSLNTPVPNPSFCCLAGNGRCSHGRTAHTHSNRITFSVSCCTLCLQVAEISDKSTYLGTPSVVFLGREGERKEIFTKTNRLHLLHHSVNQAHLNCTAGYPCSINTPPQFTEKVSLVGIDNYMVHKHTQKL